MRYRITDTFLRQIENPAFLGKNAPEITVFSDDVWKTELNASQFRLTNTL